MVTLPSSATFRHPSKGQGTWQGDLLLSWGTDHPKSTWGAPAQELQGVGLKYPTGARATFLAGTVPD